MKEHEGYNYSIDRENRLSGQLEDSISSDNRNYPILFFYIRFCDLMTR